MERLEQRRLLAAAPVITEFMAANNGSLLDGDGNSPDWVEIHNAGDAAIDLANWHLTDDPTDMTRWTFPTIELGAGQYLIVFASGSAVDDYVDPAGFLHTNFKLDAGGEYLALVDPDGETVVTEFGSADTPYPAQRGDVSFGTSIDANTTLLVASGPAPTAGPIAVPNGSFELPATAGADVEADQWNDPGGTTGVFANAAGYGNLLSGVDGLQMAFLNTGPGNQFNIDLAETFAAGLSYTLTVGIAARSDTPGSANDQLGIRLYYDGNVANTVGETAVTYGQLSNTATQDFSLALPIVSTADAWSGRPIGIQLVSIAGVGGDWTLDDVRLTSSGNITPPANTGSILVPADNGLGTDWTGGAEPLDESAWTAGVPLGIGFDEGNVVSGSGAVGYWPLDNNTADGTTGGNDGTLIGGTYSTDTPEPPAGTHSVQLNGVDQYVDFGDAPAFDFEWNDPFSLSAWIKSTDGTQDSAIVGKMVQGGTYRGYEMHVGSTAGAGRINVWLINQWPGQVIEVNGTVNVLDGQWHHVAMTYDGTGDAAGVEIFVDGVLDGAAAVGKNTLGGGSITNTVGLNVGTRNNGAHHDFAGLIDDVSVWDEAISAARVADISSGQSPLGGSTTVDVDYLGLIETDLADAMRNANASAYLRIPFQVGDPAAFDRLVLRARFEDGFVAYINGHEVARRNAPAVLAFDSTATAEHPTASALSPADLSIDLDALQAGTGALRAGQNILAVHGLNEAADDEDFLFVPELIGYETLSVGEEYFQFSTPGRANSIGVAGFVEDTKFSVDRGLYAEPFDVAITTATEGADIYFTTDGTVPAPGGATSTLYAAPITITTTTVLRAAAFHDGFEPTNVDTHTYVFPQHVLGQTNVQPGHAHWDTELDPAITGPLGGDLLAGLAELPTVSLSLPDADVFGPGGIYSNPGNRGEAWEKAASVEYYDPIDGDQFQIDAGLRVQGGASRSGADPKHSFRLLFKGQYGSTKLDFPLFDDSNVERFDQLVLRAGLGDVWTIHWGANLRQNATYFNDQWARESHAAMGGVASHGQFVHLYVNGLYWGLYNLVERPDNSFSAQHRGGDKDEWDVIHDNQVQNGDRTEWDAMMALADAGVADPADYAAIGELLDLEQFADYMILNLYAGNWDWPEHNWWAARNGADPESKFRFYAWDTEQILENQFIPDFKGGVGTVDMNSNAVPFIGNYNTPGFLYHRLRLNEDFQFLFADRVQKHLFGDGALTAAASAERFTALRDRVFNSMVAESARWGDAHVEPPLTRDGNWLPDLNLTIDEYFPQRTGVVIEQWRDLDLYPDVAAPTFAIGGIPRQGGTVNVGDVLTLAAATSVTTEDTLLVAEDHAAAAWVPVDGSLEAGVASPAWFEPQFDAAGWLAGSGGVGYEDDGDDGGAAGPYTPLIGLDVQDAWDAHESSLYTRFAFALDAQFVWDEFDTLTLDIQYDDGFVAYLNGQEVASSFAPETVAWDSLTTADAGRDEPAVGRFNLDAYRNLLAAGTNVLAIRGLNLNRGSSDMLIRPELVLGKIVAVEDAPIYYTTDGADPRSPDGSPAGTLYAGGLSLADPATHVMARTFDGGQWSALSEARFTINPAASGNVVISEVHYNPSDPVGDELLVTTNNDDFEFIELTNVSDRTVYLAGAAFEPGAPVEFTFPDDATANLAPGETVLVVKNTFAFEARFGTEHNIAGQFVDGRIGNNGEQITLLAADGQVIHSFGYNDRDPWPVAADGLGASLQLIAPQEAPDHADPTNWTAADPTPDAPLPTTVVARHIVYAGSAFDDGDGGAVAPDKTPLLPGQTATAAQLTSFASGINSLLVDVSNLNAPMAVDEDDFVFRRGDTDDPASWPAAPQPDVLVHENAGRGGADRIELVWPDGAIENTWLEVTLRHEATEFGLARDDVFYVGNAIGEVTAAAAAGAFATGPGTSPPMVNASDVVAIRDDPRGLANPASIDNPHDLNRDRFVDAVDLILARDNATSPLSTLPWLTPP